MKPTRHPCEQYTRPRLREAREPDVRYVLSILGRQRLRDAENERTYGEFAAKEGEVVAGEVQRVDVRRLPDLRVLDGGQALRCGNRVVLVARAEAHAPAVEGEHGGDRDRSDRRSHRRLRSKNRSTTCHAAHGVCRLTRALQALHQ